MVVIVTAHPNPFGAACRMNGTTRTAVAELARPLGDRAVLEVAEGLPVPVVLKP